MIRTGTAAALSFAAALAFGVPCAAADDTAPPTISATITNGKSLTLTGASRLTPGLVRVVVHSAGKTPDGGDLAILRFHPGYSFKAYVADITTFEASYGAKGPTKAGLKALDHAYAHTDAFGGVGVDQHATASETVTLPAGTYTAYNDTEDPANPVTFTVAGVTRHPTPTKSTATVTATASRFAGATVLPAAGTITFANKATQDKHDLLLVHVKEGTTLKQVNAYLHSSSNEAAAFALPGEISTDTLDPGKTQTLTYSVPQGEYVELSFAPDTQTGIYPLFTGMVKIVHLK